MKRHREESAEQHDGVPLTHTSSLKPAKWPKTVSDAATLINDSDKEAGAKLEFPVLPLEIQHHVFSFLPRQSLLLMEEVGSFVFPTHTQSYQSLAEVDVFY